MIYRWRCQRCDEVVEVERKVEDYLIGPQDNEHPGCEPGMYIKLVNIPSRIFVHENEDQYWKDDNYKL